MKTKPKGETVLNYNASTPLYEQLCQALEQQILAGEFPPGTHLPSQRKLAANYGISRITVQRAIELLEDVGYIIVRHGRRAVVQRIAPPRDTTD